MLMLGCPLTWYSTHFNPHTKMRPIVPYWKDVLPVRYRFCLFETLWLYVKLLHGHSYQFHLMLWRVGYVTILGLIVRADSGGRVWRSSDQIVFLFLSFSGLSCSPFSGSSCFWQHYICRYIVTSTDVTEYNEVNYFGNREKLNELMQSFKECIYGGI